MSFGPNKGPVKFTMPKGKSGQWTFTTQAAFTQEMELKDKNGNVIASASGSGIAIQPVTGTFDTTEGPYTLNITANGKPSRMIYSSAVNANGGSVKQLTYTFGSEDSTDRDFNDCFVVVTVFGRAG